MRFAPSGSAHFVDVVPLRRFSVQLFAIPRGRARPRLRQKYLDVAEVRVDSDATHVSGQDTYRIIGARDAYAPPRLRVVSTRAAVLTEYRALQRDMLVTTVTVGATGCTVTAAKSAGRLALPFALGAATVAGYVALLQAAVDGVGEGVGVDMGVGDDDTRTWPLAVWLARLRFSLPVLAFVALGERGSTIA